MAYVIASIARVGVFILFRVKLVSAHRRPATPSESRAGSHNFMHNGFVYTVFTELQRTVALDTAFCCNKSMESMLLLVLNVVDIRLEFLSFLSQLVIDGIWSVSD